MQIPSSSLSFINIIIITTTITTTTTTMCSQGNTNKVYLNINGVLNCN
jgi:hypothetical protein